jgi:hypothetical protein
VNNNVMCSFDGRNNKIINSNQHLIGKPLRMQLLRGPNIDLTGSLG